MQSSEKSSEVKSFGETMLDWDLRVAVTKHRNQDNFEREGLLWLIVTEGHSP